MRAVNPKPRHGFFLVYVALEPCLLVGKQLDDFWIVVVVLEVFRDPISRVVASPLARGEFDEVLVGCLLEPGCTVECVDLMVVFVVRMGEVSICRVRRIDAPHRTRAAVKADENRCFWCIGGRFAAVRGPKRPPFGPIPKPTATRPRRLRRPTRRRRVPSPARNPPRSGHALLPVADLVWNPVARP